MNVIEIELLYEPAHYNPRCACVIPAAWVAYFDNGQPKWPCGTTREEAERNVRAEYPEAVIAE